MSQQKYNNNIFIKHLPSSASTVCVWTAVYGDQSFNNLHTYGIFILNMQKKLKLRNAESFSALSMEN